MKTREREKGTQAGKERKRRGRTHMSVGPARPQAPPTSPSRCQSHAEQATPGLQLRGWPHTRCPDGSPWYSFGRATRAGRQHPRPPAPRRQGKGDRKGQPHNIVMSAQEAIKGGGKLGNDRREYTKGEQPSTTKSQARPYFSTAASCRPSTH